MFDLSNSEHPAVTADDIRVLAQSNSADPVLVLAGGRLSVMDAAQVEAAAGRVVFTKRRLVAEAGEDITDVEAELLAGRIDAALAGVPITSVPPTGVALPEAG